MALAWGFRPDLRSHIVFTNVGQERLNRLKFRVTICRKGLGMSFPIVFARIAITSSLCLCMQSCTENNEKNALNNVEIISGDERAEFLLPANLKIRKGPPEIMVFRCKYPGMEPLNPDLQPGDDDITVYITLLPGPNQIDRLMSDAAEYFDPQKPGRRYRVGKQGAFEVFRDYTGYGKPSQAEITTYVFKAEDGEFVGIKESDALRSSRYRFIRRLNKNLHVEYLVAKQLGRDFVAIDETVAAFIRKHQIK